MLSWAPCVAGGAEAPNRQCARSAAERGARGGVASRAAARRSWADGDAREADTLAPRRLGGRPADPALAARADLPHLRTPHRRGPRREPAAPRRLSEPRRLLRAALERGRAAALRARPAALAGRRHGAGRRSHRG